MIDLYPKWILIKFYITIYVWFCAMSSAFHCNIIGVLTKIDSCESLQNYIYI